jgi:hypothetical protein
LLVLLPVRSAFTNTIAESFEETALVLAFLAID